MSLSSQSFDELVTLQHSLDAARQTGAHLAVTEGSTYFPSVDRQMIVEALSTTDKRTQQAIRIVTSASNWRHVDEQSLRQIAWALRRMDCVHNTEVRNEKAQGEAEAKADADRDKLVEHCATLYGLCNAARRELGRTHVEFPRGELAERRTETLREQHRALLEQLRALNAAVAEQHKAEEPRKSKGKRRAPPPEPQRPQRTHAA